MVVFAVNPFRVNIDEKKENSLTSEQGLNLQTAAKQQNQHSAARR